MQSIVLSRKDFREFDQIISFYTKEKGKIELLARGVKKMQSKNSAHLEPFSNVLIETAKGKEIDHLIKVIPIDFFAKIRQNLNKSLGAGFLASLVDKLTEINELDEKIFNLFVSWLKFVDKSEQFSFVLLDAFIINFFCILGFNPILEYCVICKKSLKIMVSEVLALPVSSPGKLRPKGEAWGIYFAGGGIICPICRDKKRFVGEMIINIGLQEISNLQVLLKGDWRLVSEFNMEENEQKKLHKLIYEFVLFHSEKNIDDWDFAFKHTNI